MANVTRSKHRVNIRGVAIAVTAALSLGACGTGPDGAGADAGDPVYTVLTVVAFMCATYLLKQAASSVPELLRRQYGLAVVLAKIALMFTLAGIMLLGALALLAAANIN